MHSHPVITYVLLFIVIPVKRATPCLLKAIKSNDSYDRYSIQVYEIGRRQAGEYSVPSDNGPIQLDLWNLSKSIIDLIGGYSRKDNRLNSTIEFTWI